MAAAAAAAPMPALLQPLPHTGPRKRKRKPAAAAGKVDQPPPEADRGGGEAAAAAEVGDQQVLAAPACSACDGHPACRSPGSCGCAAEYGQPHSPGVSIPLDWRARALPRPSRQQQAGFRVLGLRVQQALIANCRAVGGGCYSPSPQQG